MVTIAQIKQIARKPLDAKALANAGSVLKALDLYGNRFGLDQPHRMAQFLAQLMHESGEFRHDREVWGPTPAQARYDTRTDLGNTPAADGDGKLYMGHTAMQITGKANTKAFRDWCRKFVDAMAPDFLAKPELMNTDPWEGLGPLWYWDTRKLNKYADQGDVETITKKINGGLNGYPDRLALLARASLVLLGYEPGDVMLFQADQRLIIDGDVGPKTRAAMHVALVNKTAGAMAKPTVSAAPVVEQTTVVEEKPVAVAPEQLDKPVTQTTGFWERITSMVGVLGLGSASWLGDWKVILAITVCLIIVSLIGLALHSRIVTAVKTIKQAIAS